jgi:hypothetical protein
VAEYLVHEKLALTIGIASVHDVGRRREEFANGRELRARVTAWL